MDKLINGTIVSYDCGKDELADAFKDPNQFIVYADAIKLHGSNTERVGITLVVPEDFIDDVDELKKQICGLMLDYESLTK